MEDIYIKKKNDYVDKKLKEIIRNTLDNVSCDMEENLNLQSAGINSIKFIKIIIKIEENFGFQFHDLDLYTDRFSTLRDLKTYILNRIE